MEYKASWIIPKTSEEFQARNPLNVQWDVFRRRLHTEHSSLFNNWYRRRPKLLMSLVETTNSSSKYHPWAGKVGNMGLHLPLPWIPLRICGLEFTGKNANSEMK